MNRFFKKYSNMEIGWFVIYMIFIIFAVLEYVQSKRLIMPIRFFIISYFSVSLSISYLDLKEHKKLRMELMDKCDAAKFFNEYAIVYNRTFKAAGRAMTVVMNMAVAYSQIGDYQSAIKITEDYFYRNGSSKNRRPFYLDFLYFNNLASHYICAGDGVKGRETLDKVKRMLQQNKNDRNYFAFCKLLIGNEYLLLQLDHKYEEAVQYFESALPMSSNLLEEVSTHFILSRIHLALGNLQKQREHLEFVARFGNTLAIAFEARALLQEM